MLHRRVLKDDNRGVAEPLNETANGRGLIVRGTHRLLLTEITSSDDNSKNSDEMSRDSAEGMEGKIAPNTDISQLLFYRPTVAIGVGSAALKLPRKSLISEKFVWDPFLNLITLQKVNETAILARFENRHQQGKKMICE